jgi:hypothetical protein
VCCAILDLGAECGPEQLLCLVPRERLELEPFRHLVLPQTHKCVGSTLPGAQREKKECTVRESDVLEEGDGLGVEKVGVVHPENEPFGLRPEDGVGRGA